MISYKSGNSFIIRVPLLPVKVYKELMEINGNDAFLHKCYENKVFMEAVAVASINLYKSLERYCKLNKGKSEALAGSVRKFINRSTMRTTPFGLFAGVGLGDVSNVTDVKLESKDKLKKRARVDMEWLSNIIIACENNVEYWSKLRFRFNQDCYVVGERLTAPGLGLQVQRKKYSAYVGNFMSVKNTKAVEYIFEKYKYDYFFVTDIIQDMRDTYSDVNLELLHKFFKELINMSILISELQPPQVDTSSLSYVLKILEKSELYNPLYKQLKKVFNFICMYNHTEVGQGTGIFLQCRNLMKEIFPMENEHYLQVDMCLQFENCKISNLITNEIEHFILMVQKNGYICEESDSLKEYTRMFIEKYGYVKEIPVQQLLDPDIGLGAPAGYTNPESYNTLSAFNDDVKNRLMVVIMEKLSLMSRNGENGHGIILTDEDFRWIFGYQQEDTNGIEIDTMEVAFYIVAESVEDISKGNFQLLTSPLLGSNSVCRTIGRFTDLFTDEKAKNNIRGIYAREKGLTEERGMILVEGHEMPINGRQYNLCQNAIGNELQLAVSLNLLQNHNRIELKDLVVGVSQRTDRLYIRSIKMNKCIRLLLPNMLVPSLHSNTLRFLYDVTNADQLNIFYVQNFGMGSKYKFLPRISYNKIILSPAKWYLKAENICAKGSWNNIETFDHEFSKYRKRYNIPKMVFVGDADQRLLLNLNIKSDISILMDLLKKGGVHISESLHIFEQSWIKNDQQDAFFAEFIFPLFRSGDIERYNDGMKEIFFLGTQSDTKTNSAKLPLMLKQRRIFPGKEGWWYFKLYFRTVSCDRLLGREIFQYCQGLLEEKIIDQFFFIRYADPRPHIRLRVHLINKNLDGERLSAWLEDMYEELNITSCVVDVYEREIERYGGLGLISYAERFFFYDSFFVMELLKSEAKIESENKLKYAVLGVQLIFCDCNISLKEQEILLTGMADKKKYRSEYHSQRNEIMDIVSHGKKCQLDIMCDLNFVELCVSRSDSLQRYWKKIEENDVYMHLTNTKKDILFSLIHMFCNRYYGNTEKERMVMEVLYHGTHDVNERHRHGIFN